MSKLGADLAPWPLLLLTFLSLPLESLPLVLKPLRRFADIVAIRYENLKMFMVFVENCCDCCHLLVLADVLGGYDAGNHSVLGMSELHELRVWCKAVICLVCQSCRVG